MRLFGRSLDGPQKTAAMTVGVVVLMGGLAWASVPFYDWFCRVTGFGGTTGVAEASTGEVLDRTMKIRFDASIDREMPWTFTPVEREMEVKIGQDAMAFYEATNTSDVPVAGTAAYNVTPYEAGGYFVKVHCFCFEEQVLMPGETVQMPVNFFVDPEIVDDRDAKYTHTITLSYTFYQIDLPDDTQQAALDIDKAGASSDAATPAIDRN